MKKETLYNINSNINMNSSHEKWYKRTGEIYNKFYYLGFKWEFEKNEPLKTGVPHPNYLISYVVTKVSDYAVDLTNENILFNKHSSARCIIENTLSVMFDITVLDITVMIVDEGKLKVGFQYQRGDEIFGMFEKTYYNESAAQAVDGLMSKSRIYHNTIFDSMFPLVYSSQYTNNKFEKGLQIARYDFNPNYDGDKISENFNKDSFVNGYSIFNLILTEDEYNNYSKNANTPKEKEDTPYIELSRYLAQQLGGGMEIVGYILLYLPALCDINGTLLHWNYCRANDSITTTFITQYEIVSSKDSDGSEHFYIDVKSHPCGLYIDKRECITKVKVDDEENKANITVRFTNGYNDEHLHEIVTESDGIVPSLVAFQNVLSEALCDMWGYEGIFNTPLVTLFAPHGIINIPTKISSKIGVVSDVTTIRTSIEFTPIYLTTTKFEAKWFKRLFVKWAKYDNRIKYENVFYPTKVSEDVILYKSIGRNKKTHKYNQCMILTTKKSRTMGLELADNFVSSLINELTVWNIGSLKRMVNIAVGIYILLPEDI